MLRAAFALAGFVVLVGAARTNVVDAAADPRGRSVAQQDWQHPYNGKFVFVRLRSNSRFGGLGAFGRGGGRDQCNLDAPWGHDYPCAEHSLMAILSHVTSVRPGSETGNIIALSDPDLFKYPFAYISHPGQFEMSDDDAANLRAYLLKGGFLILDDFPAGGREDEWNRWAATLERVLPDLEPKLLDASHPVFHSFFDFDSLDNLFGRNTYAPPQFIGYFEGNDTSKRLLIVANYANDLGENWEYASYGFEVIPESANEAFKFGVNYILYGLTH